MSNYKIRVNSEVENKEVQGIFKILGGAWSEHVKADHYDKEFLYLTNGVIEYDDLLSEFLAVDECKEITLPELRDLVVLKRNDVGDATHESPCGELKFILLGDWWNLFTGGKWQQFSHKQSPRCNKLKPIEKPMKEYLRKNSNGTYSYIGTVQPENVSDFMIEIPKTAELVLRNKQGKIEFFKDKCGSKFENGNWIGVSIPFARLQEGRILFLKGGCQAYWDSDFSKTLAAPFNLIESRHTHPEELPFIDDECYTNKSDGVFSLPKSEPCDISNWVEIREEGSLNDQYAEIETVRQSAWQKQEGGSHYKNLKIQPMQYALENKLDYAQANVVKYVTRHKEKNGKEDLLKAIHNLELMIEFYYGDEK